MKPCEQANILPIVDKSASDRSRPWSRRRFRFITVTSLSLVACTGSINGTETGAGTTGTGGTGTTTGGTGTTTGGTGTGTGTGTMMPDGGSGTTGGLAASSRAMRLGNAQWE